MGELKRKLNIKKLTVVNLILLIAVLFILTIINTLTKTLGTKTVFAQCPCACAPEGTEGTEGTASAASAAPESGACTTPEGCGMAPESGGTSGPEGVGSSDTGCDAGGACY